MTKWLGKQMLTIIALILWLNIFGQSNKLSLFVDSILTYQTIKIPAYQLKESSYETKVFTMDFSKSSFSDTTGMYILNNAEILSVNLLFTDYPAWLDLKSLNRNRFIQLNKYLPNAMFNPNTKWQVIRQMNGKDKVTAKDMLHGFVINYRFPASSKTIQEELEYIKSITPQLLKDTSVLTDITPIGRNIKVRHWDAIRGASSIKHKTYLGRLIKLISHSKIPLQGVVDKKDSIVTIATKEALKLKLVGVRETHVDITKDSLYVLLESLPKRETYKDVIPVAAAKALKDSTFVKCVTRNNFNQMLVIADVTSSMSRYTSQLIAWMMQAESEQSIYALVCFNDGDDKLLQDKVIGKTGGVYGARFTTIKDAANLMTSVMQKGSGGDLPENNCEAILEAINMFPEYTNVVMLADSWAPVRDIELLTKIKIPIKVIVCGNDLGPHPDYITIALQTNGSLHFNDEDITNFSLLKAGKVQIIKSTPYILKDGRVIYAK